VYEEGCTWVESCDVLAAVCMEGWSGRTRLEDGHSVTVRLIMVSAGTYPADVGEKVRTSSACAEASSCPHCRDQGTALGQRCPLRAIRSAYQKLGVLVRKA